MFGKIKIATFVVRAVVISAAGAGIAFAAGGHAHNQTAGQYAEQEGRLIKSLSAADIAALEAGRGWGFAKPAELNGYPGPLHVLELAADLGLDSDQRQRVQMIFDEMKAEAVTAGKTYLAAERALDAAFAKGAPQAEHIAELALQSGKARARLQHVHLKAHLLTTPLLSETQRHRYAVLRGYAGAGQPAHGTMKGSHGRH